VPSGDAAVISAARANVGQAITKANGYIDQVNAIDAEAHSIANALSDV
jgi:hypothetical protein